IVAETEGNPFFVVEMLRHLAESGADGGQGQALGGDTLQLGRADRAAAVGLRRERGDAYGP
ncbi:MAG: hypothetical protein M3376_09635, partial [Actinomycetota bacterium]|nr:hypothetical protein [Actinomycetota bacterium]